MFRLELLPYPPPPPPPQTHVEIKRNDTAKIYYILLTTTSVRGPLLGQRSL